MVEKIKTKTALNCIIFVFFLLFARGVYAIPQPHNITTDPDPNPYFEEDRIYFFNVTWTGQGVDNVTIEHNFTGSFINVTMNAKGNNRYLFNISNLTPGSYAWKSYANDTNGLNSTVRQNYTIKKGIPIIKLLINNSESNLTNFASNASMNITVRLFSNFNTILNPDIENVRFDNTSLPRNWFYKNIDEFTEGDSKSWSYLPLVSDSFSGSRALFIDVKKFNDDATWVASHKIAVTPSTNYTLLFHLKNVTFADQENDYGTIWFVAFDENGAIVFGNLYSEIIQFNSTAVRASNAKFIASQKDVGNGWREINVKFSTASNEKFIKIEPYFVYSFGTAHYTLDDFILLTSNTSLSKTVSINTTFPNWTLETGLSPFTNITRTPSAGLYNVTGLFNGDNNYSATNITNLVHVGLEALIKISVNQTFYSQAGANFSVFIPFQVNYSNTTGFPITGATCVVTNNETSDQITLSFNSTTNNYTCTGSNCQDTLSLYDNVLFTVTCSGNSTYFAKTNTTTTNVWWLYYLWNQTNLSYGENNIAVASNWLRKQIPNNQINITKNVTINPNATNITVFEFVLEDNFTKPNFSLSRSIDFLGTVKLRANLSASSANVCNPVLCYQIKDKFLNPLTTYCGESPSLNASARWIEQNVTINVTAETSNYIAYLIRCNANSTLENATNITITLYYNYSSDPNIEIRNAKPSPIKIVDTKQQQGDSSYTINSNTVINATWKEIITLLLSADFSDFTYRPKVVNNLSSIINTSVSVKDSKNTLLSTTITSDGLIKWTPEKLLLNTQVNETLSYSIENAINDTETSLSQKIGESKWTINATSITIPQLHTENVTILSNYSAYGALAGWNFNVTFTNESGSFDISSQITVDGSNLVMPKTRLSSLTYNITATGRPSGESCSVDNQCSTGLCCSGACASSCVTTETVTVTTGGGGIVEPPDTSVSAPKTFGVLLGGSGKFVVNVSNVVKNSKLLNVTLSFSGYLPGYVTAEPELIDVIEFNKTRQFFVVVTAPSFVTEREFILNVSVNSIFERFGTRKNVTKVATTRLVINTRVEAVNATLEEVNSIRAEMESSGFGTSRVESLIEELKSSLAEEDALRAQAIFDEILSLKERAFSVREMIKDVELSIGDAKDSGLDVPNTERFYSLALAAFLREDYEKAGQRLESALLSVAAETQGRINLAVFVVHNWPFVLAGLAVLLFAAINLYRRVYLEFVNRTLERLRRDETALRELAVNLDRQYFVSMEISKDEFHELRSEFGRRMARIKSRRTKLLEKKTGLVKAEDELKQLSDEHEKILDAIKSLQMDYFEEKRIPKSAYVARLRAYKSRLSEISEHIELVNAKMTKETRTEKLWGNIFRMLSIKGVGVSR